MEGPWSFQICSWVSRTSHALPRLDLTKPCLTQAVSKYTRNSPRVNTTVLLWSDVNSTDEHKLNPRNCLGPKTRTAKDILVRMSPGPSSSIPMSFPRTPDTMLYPTASLSGHAGLPASSQTQHHFVWPGNADVEHLTVKSGVCVCVFSNFISHHRVPLENTENENRKAS